MRQGDRYNRRIKDLSAIVPTKDGVDEGAVSTGFEDLDPLAGGWHMHDLVLLSAAGTEESEQGDWNMADVLALHMALRAAEIGETVGIIGYQNPLCIAQRLTAIRARVSAYGARLGSRRTYEALVAASVYVEALPIVIRSGPQVGLRKLEDEVLRISVEQPRLIVVLGGTWPLYFSEAEMVRLRRLADVLPVSLLCLGLQAWQGDSLADVVLSVAEATSPEGDVFAQLKVTLNRNGPTGEVNLDWDRLGESFETIRMRRGGADDGGDDDDDDGREAAPASADDVT